MKRQSQRLLHQGKYDMVASECLMHTVMSKSMFCGMKTH